MYLDPNKSIRFIKKFLYAYLATSVYFSKNWSRKDAQFFFRYTKLFQIQERQKCFQGRIPHLFQIDKSWPRLYRKIFQHLSKKIFDSGFKFSINDPPVEKALLPILIKNLNIILNEYFHQFKS